MRLYLPKNSPEATRRDVSDLTASREIGEREWEPDDVLVIPFDTEPTPTEQAAIELRLTTETPVEETLNTRVLVAYDQLAAFENQPAASITLPMLVQVVKLLCKVVRGLIRLQLRRLDKTD